MKMFCRVISFALIFTLPQPAFAYIPSAHFIIKMMMKGNQAIRDVKVEQTRITFDEDSGREDLRVPEVLYLKSPDYYRLDRALPEKKTITICNRGETFTFVDGKRTPHVMDGTILFKDLLIKRSVDDITALLRSRNVDVDRMALGRFEGKIAYIIGAGETEAELPQLWIDKESFLPIRFIMREKKNNAVVTVEIRYLNYGSIAGKFQYPSNIEFYYDGKLSLRYHAQEVRINIAIPDRVFDIREPVGNNF